MWACVFMIRRPHPFLQSLPRRRHRARVCHQETAGRGCRCLCCGLLRVWPCLRAWGMGPAGHMQADLAPISHASACPLVRAARLVSFPPVSTNGQHTKPSSTPRVTVVLTVCTSQPVVFSIALSNMKFMLLPKLYTTHGWPCGSKLSSGEHSHLPPSCG